MSRAKVILNSEEIKPTALELWLAKGSQLIENSAKFYRGKADCRVVLNTFLGLVIADQYC